MNEICESCNRPIKNGYFPTKLEVKIIRYINDFQANNKKSPSYREIQDNVGLNSTSAIHRYIHKLEKKGFLSKEPGENRSITLLKAIN